MPAVGPVPINYNICAKARELSAAKVTCNLLLTLRKWNLIVYDSSIPHYSSMIHHISYHMCKLQIDLNENIWKSECVSSIQIQPTKLL